MRLKLIYVIVFCFCFQQSAKAGFVMNPNTTAAYKAIFELRFTEARRLIQDEKSKNPDNGITILLDDYIDFLYLLNTENKADYDKFKDRKGDRIDALRDNDKTSPYYLFAQAEVYIHWGLLKAKFGDYLSSISDLNKARKALAENNDKFKDFLPNQKSLGWTDLIFGAIPSNLKGITGFFGIRGNINTGYKQMERFKAQIAGTKYSYYNDELVFLLSLANVDVLHNRNNYADMMALTAEMNEKSLLKKYLQGYVSVKTGHSDEAIKYFLEAPQSAGYMNLPVINYLLGNAKLCRMDSDANKYFLTYIRETQSINYTKDSYLKLAYFYYLKNEPTNYTNYLKLVRTKGYAIDEKDKQAVKEANDTKPDPDLLRARFYFDGGYYHKALALLKTQQVDDLKLPRDKVEYYYRLGRTYDEMNADNDALINYQKAADLGRGLIYYYAANSALFSGIIYEKRKDYKKAADYYNLALQMKNHEYQSGIDSQAKEGLARVKGN